MSRRRLVVEADGGSRGNPGPAAYGALVRDADSGELLAERAATIGVATNNVAEYRGLVAGLEAAAEIDPEALVEVRMDSKLVVEQMAGRWRIKHESMKPLAIRARSAFPYEQVSWTWVPRERNAHADALANQALDGKPIGLGPSLPPQTRASHPKVGVGSTPQGAPHPKMTDQATEEPEEAPPGSRRGWSPDLGDPTTLLLLRHGVTEHTEARRFSGRGGDDPPLTEAGQAQAAAAAAALDATVADRPVTAVVCSPLRRARETAEVAAGVLDIDVQVDDDLAECSFGAWDGLTYAEVHERWPAEMKRWRWTTHVAPPGGESLRALDRRVRRARDRVLAGHPRERVLLVAHLTPLALLARDALGAPLSTVFRLALSPAALGELDHWADGVASMRAWNSVAHLP